MALVDIETLLPTCFKHCPDFNVIGVLEPYPNGGTYVHYKCEHLDKCRHISKLYYDELLDRFDTEEHKAYNHPSGLKEHEVWNKAVRIIEEYV